MITPARSVGVFLLLPPTLQATLTKIRTISHTSASLSFRRSSLHDHGYRSKIRGALKHAVGVGALLANPHAGEEHVVVLSNLVPIPVAGPGGAAIAGKGPGLDVASPVLVLEVHG
jgi:hypothetical protein